MAKNKAAMTTVVLHLFTIIKVVYGLRINKEASISGLLQDKQRIDCWTTARAIESILMRVERREW